MTAPLPADRLSTATAVAPVAPAEAEIWVWLAGLFAEPPSVETIVRWRSPEGDAAVAALAGDPALAGGLARMRAALAAAGPEEITVRLGIAFGRLFLGIGGPETVAPYESAHTGNGLLFRAPVGEMERLLASHDLSVAAHFAEPADHLCVELALMARLAATDHPDRPAFAARLAAWVPRFCALCLARDRTGFFGGAAEVLAAMVAREEGRSSRSDEQTN